MRKGMILTMLASAMLVSCTANDGNSPAEAAERPSSSAAVTQTTAAASTSVSKGPKLPKTPAAKLITAEVKSYSEGKLTFIYEGDEYTLPLRREDMEGYDGSLYITSMPEKIIANKLGETIMAELKVDNGMTGIRHCDVMKLNGKEYAPPDEGWDNTGRFDPSYYMTMKRSEGSLCTFTNPAEVIEADLNDLPNTRKTDLPKEIYPVLLTGFVFNDGKFLLGDCIYTRQDENGGWIFEFSEEQLAVPCFFGKVTAVAEGRATVLLNDGKTTADAPCCFNDGEVKEGATVMVALDAELTLYGSGKHLVTDYAVFYTDPLRYDYLGRGFENMQWAKRGDPEGRFTVNYR